MARIITITGGKGGVGKTNISVNLALMLARKGARVCLLDADLGLANINILLGLYPEYDLEDVVLHGRPIQDVIIKDFHGIDIIPGSSGVEKIANLDQEQLSAVLASLSALDDYDYYLLDTSAGISRNVVSFCLAASELIVVITPEPTSLTDAYALLKVLSFNRFSGLARVVVNQCKNTAVASKTYNKLKDVVEKYLQLEIVPLGIVVHDKKVPEAVNRQQPLLELFPESNAAKCIQVMASRLMEKAPPDFSSLQIGSFWSRFIELARGPLKFSVAQSAPAADGVDGGLQPDGAGNDAPSVDSPEETDVFQKPLDTQPCPDSAAAAQAEGGSMLKLAENLPTLPHILLKLIETCSRDDASMKDLAQIVEKDPSLSSKILKMVNSVYYSFSRKVNNFHQALTLLGIDTIRSIAVSASVYQVFDSVEEESGFNMKQFWWHSLMCAVLSNLIAKQTAYPMPEEAFLAGLLHDIGKLILLKNYPDEYAAIVKDTGGSIPSYAEEMQRIGVAHADTGACLIKHWNLQSFIADAVLYHHESPERVEHALPLVKIVYAANTLCSAQRGSKELRYATAQTLLDLSQDDADRLLARATDQVQKIAESLEIVIEHPESGLGPDSAYDQAIQGYLANQIRDISLLQGTLQKFLHARDRADILVTAHQGLHLLFDIKTVLFFLHDEHQRRLLAAAPEGTPFCGSAGELAIPLRNRKSMLVAALDRQAPLDSFEYADRSGLTIMDEQLIRLMGHQGMVCCPMIVRKEPLGVMVIALDEHELQPLRDSNNLIKMFANHAALALDADAARTAQAQKVLAERLAASTAIAGKVAHEVNNPLSIIKNYLKILELKLTDEEIATDEIKIIYDEIDRVAQIIDQLSDFSRPRKLQIEPVDVNAVLGDMVTLSEQSLAARGITVEFSGDAGLPTIATDKNALKQVCINLMKNAEEALGERGCITVTTQLLEGQHAVELVIGDDGPGLPEIVQARMFEPYISTKGSGHAGLGLSVVYSIVKELGGTITCDTGGAGTSFTIVLPVSIETA